MQDSVTLFDYLECSALVAAGATLADVRLLPGGRRCALEVSGPGVEKMLADHRAGRLQVPSLAFAGAIERVKSLIFAARAAAGDSFPGRGGR